MSDFDGYFKIGQDNMPLGPDNLYYIFMLKNISKAQDAPCRNDLRQADLSFGPVQLNGSKGKPVQLNG